MSLTTKVIIFTTTLVSIPLFFFAFAILLFEYNNQLLIMVAITILLILIFTLIIVISCYEVIYNKYLSNSFVYNFLLKLLKPITLGLLIIFITIGVITCYDLVYYRFIEKSFVYKDTRFIESVGNYIKKEGGYSRMNDRSSAKRDYLDISNYPSVLFRYPGYCTEIACSGRIEPDCAKTIKLESIYYTSDDNKKDAVFGTYIGQVDDFVCKYNISTREKFSRWPRYFDSYYSGDSDN